MNHTITTLGKSLQKSIPCLIAAGVLTASSSQGEDTDPRRGLNERLFVVPAPENVVIDGDLGEWDRSGEVFSYNSEETREEKNGRMSLMYDDEALYIGAEVADPNPMMNRHDPEANPDKVWNADSVQVRLVIDRDEDWPVPYSKYSNAPRGDHDIQHLLLWYYTDGKQPGLQLRLDMDFKVPESWQPHGLVAADGFDAAYRKHDDGKGYTLEYRVPWKTLDATNPPRAGDMVAGSIQYNWSRPDGLVIHGESAPWARDVVKGSGFPFQSATVWGKFIFSERNDIPAIATGSSDDLVPPMPLEFSYTIPRDGNVNISIWDQDNVLVRNIVTDQPRAAGDIVEKWDGLDHKGDPIPAGEYTWKGLIHDPIETEFLLSVHNSGNPPWKTSDGKGGWGADHGEPTTAERYGDQMILAWEVGEAGWAIIRVTADGEKLASADRANATVLAVDADGHRVFAANSDYGPGHVQVLDARNFRPMNFEGGRGQPQVPDGGADKKVNAVTGLVYGNGTLYTAYGNRDLIAVNDGRTGELVTTWRVPAPGRLAWTPDGTLLAISGNRVVSVVDGETRVVIDGHLDTPAGIAVGPDGRIYVTNRGQRQNISVFAADGSFVREIGSQGGRPRVGRYRSDGMLTPAGCAIDSRGRVWVAEQIDSPKRISVWDPDTGENVAEYFGASAYSPTVIMDPNHADEVYCHNTLWKVDLDTGAKRPYSTLWRPSSPNSPPAPHGGFRGAIRVFTAVNGKQYGFTGGTLFHRDGPIFKPILAMFGPRRYPVTRDNPLFQGKTRPGFSQNCVWTDANDDQIIQADEVELATQLGKGPRFEWVDEHLNLYRGRTGRYGRDPGCIWNAVAISDEGIPRYDLKNPQPLPFVARSSMLSLWTDPDDGSLYQDSHAEDRGDVAFGRWTRDGQRLWGIPGTLNWKKTLSMPHPGPGEMYGLTAPLGVAGDFTGIAMYYSGYHLLRDDGQYVAMIMNPPPKEGLGPDKLQVELLTGQLVKLTDSGRYILLTGDQDGRVMEVHGLDSVRELDGGVWRMADEDLTVVEAAQREFRRQTSRDQTLVVHRGKQQLDTADPIVRKTEDGARCEMRLARDDHNLYLRYDVSEAAPLINAVLDPKILYTGGNCIDLQVAGDSAAPSDRDVPAPGDVRLIVTRQEGEPKAVLFEPNVPGIDGDPIVLESPVDRESFDRIRQVDGIELDYTPTDNGFTAVVAVPLELLGLSAVPGMGVRMDVGYIFGNSTGRSAVRRVYWQNNGFEANVVDDIPDESRLNPEHWGQAVFE